MNSSVPTVLSKQQRIYLDGIDNLGWSIDSDAQLLRARLISLGSNMSNSILNATVVHNLWWNNFLNPISLWYCRMRGANIILTASNFIDLNNPEFELRPKFLASRKFADVWVAPGRKQLEIFESHQIPSFYYPFEVERIYRGSIYPHSTEERARICQRLGIPLNVVDNRIILGSFQRDSLGSDLSKPKWQKGADRIIELVRDLPRSSFILILAGPRRHFLKRECLKFGIPYFFVGTETNDDDLTVNNLSSEIISQLYRLVDIYLVTSRSEGGPKAVLEAAASRTFILSTDVGMARDFLDSDVVFQDFAAFQRSFRQHIQKFNELQNYRNVIIERNFQTFERLQSDSNLNRLLADGYRLLGI